MLTDKDIALIEQSVDDLCHELIRWQDEFDKLMPSNPRRDAIAWRMDEARKKIDQLLGVAAVESYRIGEALRPAA
jgi:hypothetical protein